MLCFPSYLTIADAFLLFHHWIICKCFPFRARSTGHWSFSKIVSQPFKSDCGFVTTFDNKQPIISEVLTTVTLGGEGLSGAVAALNSPFCFCFVISSWKPHCRSSQVLSCSFKVNNGKQSNCKWLDRICVEIVRWFIRLLSISVGFLCFSRQVDPRMTWMGVCVTLVAE